MYIYVYSVYIYIHLYFYIVYACINMTIRKMQMLLYCWILTRWYYIDVYFPNIWFHTRETSVFLLHPFSHSLQRCKPHTFSRTGLCWVITTMICRKWKTKTLSNSKGAIQKTIVEQPYLSISMYIYIYIHTVYMHICIYAYIYIYHIVVISFEDFKLRPLLQP